MSPLEYMLVEVTLSRNEQVAFYPFFTVYMTVAFRVQRFQDLLQLVLGMQWR